MPTVRITGMAVGGDGIGRLGGTPGKVVFCEGGLPDELVEVELTSEHKDYARGTVVRVLEPAGLRVDPPCPHVTRGCGGCQWQHVAETGQLELKTAIVRDALRRIAKVDDIVVAAAGHVPLAGYRTSARLAVDAEGRPAYARRHSHDLVPVDSCLVAHPLLAELIADARFARATQVTLKVSVATGERAAWPDRGRRHATVPAGTVVAPDAAITETVAARRWRVSVGSFFQSGPQAATVLTDAVRAAAGDVTPGDTIADLYAGVGLLGGTLASETGASLIAVESSTVAVADAEANLAHLDARVRHAEVATSAGRAHLVIADPPRRGLGQSASAAVASWGALVVVLVSCDPASLARDLTLLAAHGYTAERVGVLDLFPGTAHVETVTRLVRPGAQAG